MVSEKITSVKNPLIQRLRSLRDRKGRESEGLFLVEGEKLIREALLAGLVPAVALIQQDKWDAFAPLCALLEAVGALVHPVSEHVLGAAADTVSPSGCCAAFSLPQGFGLDAAPRLLVALDGVQDPGNVGTIWRTADAAGFLGLLLGEGCADALSPKVQRAAMGSSFRLPVLQSALPQALVALKAQGYSVVTTELSGVDIHQRPALGQKMVLVIGSEARGVSPEVSELADMRLRLPMRGGAESLNAAVAAGIVMYELMRGQ